MSATVCRLSLYLGEYNKLHSIFDKCHLEKYTLSTFLEGLSADTVLHVVILSRQTVIRELLSVSWSNFLSYAYVM